MRYYRIMSEGYYNNPFSYSSNAGRWNPKGSGMIYAGSSPAVSLLEYICIKGNSVARVPWYMVVYEIMAEHLMGTLDADNLPDNWNVLPHGRSTQIFGKAWLDEKEFPFLRVPSARVNIAFYPQEHNLLINPDFPDLTQILKAVDQVPFSYLLGTVDPDII